MKIDNDQDWKVISYFRHRAGEGLALTVISTFTFLFKQWPKCNTNQRNYWFLAICFRIPRGQSTSCIVNSKAVWSVLLHLIIDQSRSQHARYVWTIITARFDEKDVLPKIKRCWCYIFSIRPCMYKLYIMHRTKQAHFSEMHFIQHWYASMDFSEVVAGKYQCCNPLLILEQTCVKKKG